MEVKNPYLNDNGVNQQLKHCLQPLTSSVRTATDSEKPDIVSWNTYASNDEMKTEVSFGAQSMMTMMAMLIFGVRRKYRIVLYIHLYWTNINYSK